MPSTALPLFRNRLVNALSPNDRAALSAHLEPVELKLRAPLVETDAEIEHLYFIESGIASMVIAAVDGEQIEIGHIGWEGLSGSSVCLGVTRGSIQTFMQMSGHGTRIRTADFRRLMATHPSLRDLMLRYIYVQQIQIAHAALVSARYDLRQRLARWLLMCHDRVEGDVLVLTHEFLSLMLGVRRAGVTGEMHILEGMGLVKATRGNVRILDRQRIEALAGGSYGHPETVYNSIIGSRPQR